MCQVEVRGCSMEAYNPHVAHKCEVYSILINHESTSKGRNISFHIYHVHTHKDLVVSPEKLEYSATLSSNSRMATIRGKQETVSLVVYGSQFTAVFTIPRSYICVHNCTWSSCSWFSFSSL